MVFINNGQFIFRSVGMKLTKFFLFSLVIFFSVLIKLSAVSLRPHQQFVVDYLQRESSQKGLLVSHALGSGKTYLALGYSELHPKKKVIGRFK